MTWLSLTFLLMCWSRSVDVIQPESHSGEFFVELKNKKRNGVESAVDEPWLYVYGESQLGEIFSKKYVGFGGMGCIMCFSTALYHKYPFSNWGLCRYSHVVGVHFQYASFEAILQHAVSKLSGFVNLQYLTFDSTALVTFQQLQALLVKLRKLPKFVSCHNNVG